jgi:hypothetical protein
MIHSKFNGYSRDGIRLYRSGGGGGGTSTTTQEIPDELKPLATQYTQDAINLSNTPYQAYGGQRYADIDPIQSQAVGMIQNRAAGGSPVFDAASQNLTSMMQGGTNPYLDASVQRAQDSVMSNMNSQMAQSGSFGNSGIQEATGKALGDVAGQMYGSAYESDAGRRMQAIGMAPQFANQAYTDASQLMNAGQFMQDQSQQNYDFGYQQFQDEQNDPYKKLAAMSGVFGTNLGGSSTTTQSGGSGK